MITRTRIEADVLQAFVSRVFRRLGLPDDDARIAADVLVLADLRGVETHGVGNLPMYVEPLRSGQANPRPRITIVHETPVSALVDGDGGLGLVVGVKAMEMCIAKAADLGLATVAVRRSKHYGMASYYSMMCLPHELIGVSMTNNSGVGVVPTFGNQPMISSNPISVAAPADREPPFVLDCATTVAAMNKVAQALARDEKIPFGWALDKTGQPTDDPRAVLDARKFLPLGGTRELGSHKGYGFAVVVDILAGLLSGGTYGNLVQRNPPADEKLHPSSSHFFAALQVGLFRPVEEFKAAMDDMLRALKESEVAEGHDRIYTHGEIEFEAEQDRRKNGIPYHPVSVEQMVALANEFGITLKV